MTYFRLQKRIGAALAASVALALFLASCATTSEVPIETKDETQIQITEQQSEEKKEAHGKEPKKEEKAQPAKKVRKRVDSIPEIIFADNLQRIELEDMYTEDISFDYDEEYSGSFAGKINSAVSVAKATVVFGAGSYEILAREKAEDSSHAAFYIFVNNEPYRVSPSEPPLQSFESTTRFPVTFTLEEGATVLITVQSNSPKHLGQIGMMIDYLQIRKVN